MTLETRDSPDGGDALMGATLAREKSRLYIRAGYLYVYVCVYEHVYIYIYVQVYVYSSARAEQT